MLTNRELIQDVYEAFARGDAGRVLASFHPGIVWLEAENFPYADRNPYIGAPQVAEGVFGRLMAEWAGFTVEPRSLFHDGDTVIAIGRYRGTFRVTGRAVDAQFVHVWTVSDGRVSRFQQFTDTAQFARATDLTAAAFHAPLADMPAAAPQHIA